MKRLTRALTLASALTVAGPIQAQELLRWGFQEGDTWQYRLTQNWFVRGDPLRDPDSGQLMGESIRQSPLRTLTLEAAVRQVATNGDITVDWTYTRAQMSTELGGTSFEWDSDRPDLSLAETPLGSRVAVLEAMAILGRTLTVVMTPLGQILEVRGAEAMLTAILEGLDPAMAPMMEEQFGPMYVEQQMAAEFTGGLAMLPETPVAVGDSWTTHSEVAIPMFGGSITSETRNTVTGFENQSGERVVLILHEGTMELGDPGLGGALPMTMTIGDESLSLSGSGSTTFSLDRGLILSSTSTYELVMTVSMPAVQIRGESTTVLELVGPATP